MIAERSRMAMRRYLTSGALYVLERVLIEENNLALTPEQVFGVAAALTPKLDALIARAPAGTTGADLLDAAIEHGIEITADLLGLERVTAHPTQH